jgi:hypothetical protein
MVENNKLFMTHGQVHCGRYLSIHQWSVLSHPAACRRSQVEAVRVATEDTLIRPTINEQNNHTFIAAGKNLGYLLLVQNRKEMSITVIEKLYEYLH